MSVAPTITGTQSDQTTVSGAPVDPFAWVTIGDANAVATDTLTITLSDEGAGGTLADGTGFIGLVSDGSGVYTLTGTAAAITSELDALVFTATAGKPNTTTSTGFTLSDVSSPSGLATVDNTTTMIDSDPAVAPTISGTVAGQTTMSEVPIDPFSAVTIGDANSRATDTLTVTLSNVGAGGTLADGTGFSGLAADGSGVYTLTGTASVITSELDALVFTPTVGEPNTTTTTGFALSDQSGACATATIDNTTSAIDNDPAVAPTITGTVAGQTTTSEAPIDPFSGVTVGDENFGATDTLTITLSDGGAGGTLADRTGFSSLVSLGAGVCTLSGTAAAITSELDALVFTPTAGQPNTATTTTFTLSDVSSAYGTRS